MPVLLGCRDSLPPAVTFCRRSRRSGRGVGADPPAGRLSVQGGLGGPFSPAPPRVAGAARAPLGAVRNAESAADRCVSTSVIPSWWEDAFSGLNHHVLP